MAPRLSFESLEARLAMAFTPVGAPTRISDFDPVFATETNVAMDAQGNFVAVWSEGDGQFSIDNSRLYGRRFDRLGLPLGEPFRINTLDNDPEGARVKMTPDGRFVVAWQSYSRFDSAHLNDVYVRVFAADGTPQGDEVRVNADDTNQRDMIPDIAINSSGAYVVTWENGTFEGHIFARRYGPDGLPLGNEFQVDVNTVCQNYDSMVAMNDDGSFAVTWSWSNACLLPPNPTSDQFVRRFDANGSPIGNIQGLANRKPVGSGAIASLGTTNDDGYAVIFHNGKQIFLQSAPGTRELVQIASSQISASYAKIEVVHSSILVSWLSFEHPNIGLFSLEGNPIGEALTVDPNGPSAGLGPGLSATGNSAVISWGTSDGPFFQRYSFNPLAGDVNGDERVNLHDFAILRSNFGETGKQRYEGDLTGDGKVDIEDFSQLRANFGRKAELAQVPQQAAAAKIASHINPSAAAAIAFSSAQNQTEGNRNRSVAKRFPTKSL